jgi:hypothetical protein
MPSNKPNIFDGFLATRTVQNGSTSKAAWRSAESTTMQENGGDDDISDKLSYNRHSAISMQTWIYTELSPHLHFLDQAQRCAYCHESYIPRENIGQFRCTYHPQLGRAGRYGCCGSGDGAHGCMLCDHSPERTSPRWSIANYRIQLPYLLLPHFAVRDDSLVPELWHNEEDPARNYVFVERIRLSVQQRQTLVSQATVLAMDD